MNWRVGMLAREAMCNVIAIGARTSSILFAVAILDPRLRIVDAISAVQPTLSTSGGSIRRSRN